MKRSQLSERPWSARCPGWLRLDKAAGKFIIVEERAEIVRRIYREALAGVGHATITRRLNEEQVPLFGLGNQKGKIWQKPLIRHFLTTPTVIGTHVPFVTDWTDGIRRVRPQCRSRTIIPPSLIVQIGMKSKPVVPFGLSTTETAPENRTGQFARWTIPLSIL